MIKYAGVVTDISWLDSLYRMPGLRKKRILKEQETSEEDLGWLMNPTKGSNIFPGLVLDPYCMGMRVFQDELNIFNNRAGTKEYWFGKLKDWGWLY